MYLSSFLFFFFFNDTATTEIYTLSLHDALPISENTLWLTLFGLLFWDELFESGQLSSGFDWIPHCLRRSEEHTSELQSRPHLVCRLLLEKKKKKQNIHLL